MPTQANAAYLAEKDGRLEHLIAAFSVQRKYLDAAFSAFRAFSEDDSCFCLSFVTHAAYAGEEFANLHSIDFRAELLRGYQLAGFDNPRDFRERFDQFSMLRSLRENGTNASNDGLRYFQDGDTYTAMYFATTALASSSADMDYIDVLPPADAPTLHCVLLNNIAYASARVMVSEVMEKLGRPKAAIEWASTELEESANRNLPSKTR